MGLAFWDKPSSACLSSRIPYGEKIRVDNLLMVEQAGDFLKSLGFIQVRVRAHGKLARIELLEDLTRRTFAAMIESAAERAVSNGIFPVGHLSKSLATLDSLIKIKDSYVITALLILSNVINSKRFINKYNLPFELYLI